jgi:hypothetical protein
MRDEDPIVAEVRQVREAHAARFGHDLTSIVRDIQERERASGQTFVSLPPRRIGPAEQEAARIRLRQMLENDGETLPSGSTSISDGRLAS